MALPDFLVVGAARSGTTSLHHYLRQHPELCLSATKEPNHFLFEQTPTGPVPLIDPRGPIVGKSVGQRAAYERLFRPRAGEHVLGEASPLYLYTRQTPALVRAAVPDARIVAVLRDPVDRAYSHFLHVSTGHGDAEQVTAGFAAAVAREEPLGYEPYRSGTHALRLGRYGEQLQRYLEVFDRAQLHVVRQADLQRDPAAVLRGIFGFLGVDPAAEVDTTTRHNPSGMATNRARRLAGSGPRSMQARLKRRLPAPVVQRLIGARDRARASAFSTPPPVPADLRARLLEDYYADDLALLDRLSVLPGGPLVTAPAGGPGTGAGGVAG